jgi:hypothetical protein
VSYTTPFKTSNVKRETGHSSKVWIAFPIPNRVPSSADSPRPPDALPPAPEPKYSDEEECKEEVMASGAETEDTIQSNSHDVDDNFPVTEVEANTVQDPEDPIYAAACQPDTNEGKELH